jgi:hypothetical protein
MPDYKKKSREYLLLIFIIGCVAGSLEVQRFDFSKGLPILFLSMGIGYILNFLVTKLGSRKKDDLDDNVIDAELNSDNLKQPEKAIITKMRPFKYGVFISLIFLLMAVLEAFLRKVLF